MRTIGTLGICFLIWTAAIISGCKSGTPQTGLRVRTFDCTIATADGPCLDGTVRPVPHIPISGVTYPANDDYYDPTTGQDQSQGSVTNFGFHIFPDPDVDTGQSASVVINNARTPAYWNMYVLWPFPFQGTSSCGGAHYTLGEIYYEGNYYWGYEFDDVLEQNYYTTRHSDNYICMHTQYGLLPASTRFAVLGNLPGTITLSSNNPLTTTYGMPLLYVYDGTATVVATETATSVSSDGSQATFPFPASLAQNAYSLAVVNRAPTIPVAAGTNYLSIAKSSTISGNPFGVSVGTQGYTFLETNTCTRPATKTTSSNTFTIPVITLYSTNQVNIGGAGGATIGVGANPTAVIAYNSNPVTTTTSGCDSVKETYSGSTRAIVANSGGNTVSILDLVHNTLLSTVTVGNRPVALAVSSDGKTAYIANYADSTVTQVSLTTNGTTATIAVGGKPTSVTLTAGGTLWVGGAGFLTEINSSTMSVIGTETTQVKNIVGLSYSDQLGQLVLQSTDSTGAVYEDEMNPASFASGGTYSALASHNVSSLGTYTVGSTQVRAFTSTLSSSSTLPINLPGAPPLVVRDEWAVVTATPTGFTITDATGHNVLVSQTTASPIAAIAVDTNLDVVYLTEPDSNIVLAVPLPGITPLN